MNLKLEVYKCLCAAKEFTINGIDASDSDFGDHFDRNPEEAEPYCCGNMRFTRIKPDKDVLTKYSITEKEYNQVCNKLEDMLSFGACGLCS